MGKATLITRITRETLIGDLVEEHPEVVEMLLSYGVHCVGCQVSPFESIEQGFRGHGLGEKEIEEVLAKINGIVSQKPVSLKEKSKGEVVPNVSVSSLAAQKMKELCVGHQRTAIRIAIKPGGCNGYSYGFYFADAKEEDDIVLEKNGATVFIDRESLEKMNGAEIEYIDTLTNAGFKVKNPQAKSSCGCGNSFS